MDVPNFSIKKYDNFIVKTLNEEFLSTDEYVKSEDWVNIRRKTLSKIQGIYFLLDENKEIVYIGQSKHIGNRITQHSYDKDFCSFTFIVCESLRHRLREEKILIDRFKPKYNLEWRDEHDGINEDKRRI